MWRELWRDVWMLSLGWVEGAKYQTAESDNEEID